MSQPGGGSPIRVTVEARAHGWRLDHYLVRLYPNFSRTQFQASIASDSVTVNGLSAKSSRRLRVNDVIELSLPEESEPRVQAEDLPLSVLYEDEHLVAIDKSANMIVHPGRGQTTGTLVAALQFHFDSLSDLGGTLRPGIVHRLDRDTSGALVFARSEEAKGTLQDNWGDAEKTYLAFVEGHPDPPEDTISSHLVESEARRVYSTNDPSAGKLSHTKYKVLKTVGDRSLLEVHLLTGRKNQIRVHLADKGWPIVGDAKYGRKIHHNKRLALHSHTLSFDHPYSGQRETFTAPIPDTFHRMAAAPPPRSRPEGE